LDIVFFGGPPNKSKTSPENGHPRIAQNDFPNFRAIFCAIRLRETILLHLTENMSGVLFKTSPKTGEPRIAQNGFPTFATIFCIFLRVYKTTA
jgi:hypothetical protein